MNGFPGLVLFMLRTHHRQYQERGKLRLRDTHTQRPIKYKSSQTDRPTAVTCPWGTRKRHRKDFQGLDSYSHKKSSDVNMHEDNPELGKKQVLTWGLKPPGLKESVLQLRGCKSVGGAVVGHHSTRTCTHM